jgi:hypothetical protein
MPPARVRRTPRWRRALDLARPKGPQRPRIYCRRPQSASLSVLDGTIVLSEERCASVVSLLGKLKPSIPVSVLTRFWDSRGGFLRGRRWALRPGERIHPVPATWSFGLRRSSCTAWDDPEHLVGLAPVSPESLLSPPALRACPTSESVLRVTGMSGRVRPGPVYYYAYSPIGLYSYTHSRYHGHPGVRQKSIGGWTAMN